jgi:hypothetical protein
MATLRQDVLLLVPILLWYQPFFAIHLWITSIDTFLCPRERVVPAQAL